MGFTKMMRGAPKQCAQSLWRNSSITTTCPKRGFANSKPEPPRESQSKEHPTEDGNSNTPTSPKESKTTGSHHKTIAELDEEMKLKMSGLSGDGGEAGVEYEDGKPVAMKRSVKNNMFRYI